MGIWSVEGFASDEALDWLQRLDPAEGTEPVRRALHYLAEWSDPDLDATRAVIALAAAELVAALYGHPHPSLPEPARRWLAAQSGEERGGGADVEALVLATRALDFVVTSSELAEIWSQRADERVWRAALDDLRMRLAAAGGAEPGSAAPAEGEVGEENE